jgi:hypothetical protein
LYILSVDSAVVGLVQVFPEYPHSRKYGVFSSCAIFHFGRYAGRGMGFSPHNTATTSTDLILVRAFFQFSSIASLIDQSAISKGVSLCLTGLKEES